LLAFSRRQTLRSAVVDLSALVDELLPILRSLVGAHIAVEHQAQSVWPITADPSQLDRVLVNLATNARDAMPNGGTLTIRTSNVVVDAGVDGLSAGTFVLLQVTDTGVGMDEATQARVFEPFFSTRELGRGLGLSAVYGIVAQMNGGITVKSEPEKGATFSLYFPKGEARITGALSESRSGAATLEAAGALLLVEDDASVRAFLRQLLEGEGFRVLAAEHRASALQMVAGSNEPIALIITDVMMPGGSGPALVEAVERIRPGVPALFISGEIDALGPEGGRSPDLHFLQKPFSADELLSRVRRILTPPV
jgi:two-component system cell cycle sensor histidine kinase/response regulator CckA